MVIVNKQRHPVPGHWEVQVLAKAQPKQGARFKLADGSVVEVRGAIPLSPKWQQIAKAPPGVKGWKKPSLVFSLVCSTVKGGKESQQEQWHKKREEEQAERSAAHLAEFIERATAAAEELRTRREQEAEAEKRKQRLTVGDLNYE